MAKQARSVDQSELFPAKTLAKKAGRSPEEAARAAVAPFRPRYQGTE